MSIVLRIVLFAASVLTMMYIIRKIRKSKMRIEASFFWIFFSFLCVLFATFPGIARLLAKIIGINSPVNFLFLLFIFLLLIKVFALSIKISRLENSLSELAQKIALDKVLYNNSERDVRR